MGLFFYPRGGSAHVARNLAAALPNVTVMAGSTDGPGDATRFYPRVRPVPAILAAYEDKPGSPDVCFARVDDHGAEAMADHWARALARQGEFDVLHLHHLTPLNEAAARVMPGTPVVGHLHGTELLMLEAIEREPSRWPYGPAWAERMRGWAARLERVIVLSENQIARSQRVLPIDSDRFVVVPNGFDPEAFEPRPVDRAGLWRHVVGEPLEGPVLLYVGRFTEVKRVPLLIEAYARAREGFTQRAPLVLVGGFPGEYEGEHPRDAIERTGARDVFLAGWHDHDELPTILNAADAIILPSVREQFGQVLVEGMACGLPAIAVDAHGPADIVKHGETGWLVEPDDVVGLANALVEAVNRPAERRRRGAAARADVAERFAWPALARLVENIYIDATSLREDAVLSG